MALLQVYGAMDFGEALEQKRRAIIGANLRALRRRYGLTLEEVASRASISLALLAQAEQGRRALGGENLRAVVQQYGYSLCVFLSLVEALLRGDAEEEPATDGVLQRPPIVLIGRRRTEPSLLLLHPTPQFDTPAHLAVVLPPHTELWRSYLELPSPCAIVSGSAQLVVETPQREFLLAEGDYLRLLPHVPHRFRNPTSHDVRAYIWVETACV